MRKLLKKFRDSESGAFLPLFGVMVFPLLTMILGASVDYSRMTSLQSRMQSASDIALLAATKAIQSQKGNKTPAQINQLLKNEFTPFFEANMRDASEGGYTYSPTFDSQSNESKVKVTVQYKPVFMQMFGYNTIDVDVELAVNLKVELNNYVIDIVMCIDATGSMQNTLNAAVSNAKSFNADLRQELGLVGNPSLKVRVRPMFYRDWEDATNYHGLSPLDGGTSHIAHNNSSRDVFKYENNFIDLDPNDASKKSANANKLENFLDSENATGGGDLPEAAAVCINQGTRSNWFNPTSSASRDYFNIGSGIPINQPNAPNNVNVSVVPVIVFWSDANISNPSTTRYYIDSTQPSTWNSMKSQVWDKSSLIDQDAKIMVHFGPDPNMTGYERAYAYWKVRYPHWSEYYLNYYANAYKNHSAFATAEGWDEVKQWDGYAYGGSLQTGNENGAKIIGEKIKEKLPDLLRLAS